MMDTRTDRVGLQDITRIWASFHFLPYDLHATRKGCGKRYLDKYRLICKPNSDLVVETVNLAKGKSLQAAGAAMHVLADTWAHSYFAGTPSFAINNTNYHFYELVPDGDGFEERKIKFIHSTSAPDDFEKSVYVNSLYQTSEKSIMNLGHGRAGHLPDYSFMRYKYLPAWADYEEILKDNPKEYFNAFCQMVYALRYLRGESQTFEKETYDTEKVAPYASRIKEILIKRQGEAGACEDWKAFGEELSGCTIDDFDMERYQDEYTGADKAQKNATFLGKFILAALSQKSMVTNRIFKSGNKLAGYSVDYEKKGFRGNRDFKDLVDQKKGGGQA